MYRRQRHIYDLSRKYYLLGRDRRSPAFAPRPATRCWRSAAAPGAIWSSSRAAYPAGASLRPRRLAGNARDRGGFDRARRAFRAHRPRPGGRHAFDPRELFGERMLRARHNLLRPVDDPALARRAAARSTSLARRLAAYRRFRRLRRLAWPVQGGLRRWLAAFDVTPRDDLERRARSAVGRARHDVRDRELVSRLRGAGGRAAKSLSAPPRRLARPHPPNARDSVKIKSPTSPPTSVPLMRIYCRSLPTCSSRRLTSVAVSQLSTTAAI